MSIMRIAVSTAGVIFVLFSAAVQASKPTVAVFDFDIGTSETTEMSVVTHEGTKSARVESSRQTNLLTNKLISELTNSGAVAVVERDKMQQIMQEVQLTQADLTDPKHAIRIGKLLGAGHLIFGSITLIEPNVTIKDLPYNAGKQKIMSMTVGGTMRLVQTETGQIQAAADLKATKSAKQLHPDNLSRTVPRQFQDAAYSALVDKLAARVIDNLSPIKVAQQSGNTLYLTRAGLTVGQRYQVVKLGEPVRHPDTGAILGQTEKQIATIRVTGGMQQMSKAEVTDWKISDHTVPAGSICRPLN